MNIIDRFFDRTAKINLEKVLDYAYNTSEELLKKKGIQDMGSLKNKLIEYAIQQGGNEQSLANFATQDKFLTFMRRMLIDMPNISAPTKPEEQHTNTPEESSEQTIEDAYHMLFGELHMFFPEQPISYGEWSQTHQGLINSALNRVEQSVSKQLGSQTQAQDLVRKTYWSMIDNEDNIL